MSPQRALAIAMDIMEGYQPYEGAELDEPDCARHMEEVEEAVIRVRLLRDTLYGELK